MRYRGRAACHLRASVGDLSHALRSFQRRQL